MQDTTDYIGCFAKLHTDSSHARWSANTCYRAPHKPLLLLAVIDLINQGTITSNLIRLTPELGELFTLYWSRIMSPDRRGNLAMPFFHLKSDGFWHLVPQSDKALMLSATYHTKSINQLRELILGAKLDEKLFELLCNPTSCEVLRMILIKTYFPTEIQSSLIEQGTINLEAFKYSELLLEQVHRPQLQTGISDEGKLLPAVRDQGFRRAVTFAYSHRCALCGIRLVTADGHTVVDAAHIIPWSVSRNDDPRNGMSLCRLCHWTFDQGLLSISSKYLIIDSPQLRNIQNIPGHLLSIAGRKLLGPNDELLWPGLTNLYWHRQEIFRKR